MIATLDNFMPDAAQPSHTYAMADAVKVIDGAIAAFGAEPMAWRWFHLNQWHVTNDEGRARDLAWDGVKVIPLYTAPPAPVAVPDLKELEAILNWILMLPCPTPKATQMAMRLAVVIEDYSAAMLQGADGNSPVIQDDVRRMDWLVSKTVDVREPMVYGSHSLFWSQTISNEEDDYHATKLREQIDAAMATENAAAPQQEVK